MRTTCTKTFTFDAAHRLADHPGLCKNLHGHTYKLEVTAEAATEGVHSDMVIDFGELSKLVKENIVSLFDHATIINACNTRDTAETELHQYLIKHCMRYILLPYKPTAENMAKFIMTALQLKVFEVFGDNLEITCIRLYETPTSFVEVHND